MSPTPTAVFSPPEESVPSTNRQISDTPLIYTTTTTLQTDRSQTLLSELQHHHHRTCQVLLPQSGIVQTLPSEFQHHYHRRCQILLPQTDRSPIPSLSSNTTTIGGARSFSHKPADLRHPSLSSNTTTGGGGGGGGGGACLLSGRTD